MNHDVFISYSSKDQKNVEDLSAYLEQNEIRCFVAYRDIPPGAVWAAKITEAIENCKMMIVVFSEHFNNSTQVDKEIEICIGEGKHVLPFKIEDIKYIGAKKYFLTNLHHIDAFPNPEKYFGKLCETIKNLFPELMEKTVVPKPSPRQLVIKDPPENGSSPTYDDDYWIKRSSKESMNLMKHFKEIFAEYLEEYDLKYNKVFIGLNKDDKVNNFMSFTPQRSDLVVCFVIDKTEGINKKLKKSALCQLTYDDQLAAYKIKIRENDLIEKRDILNFLVKTAYESSEPIQKKYWIEKSSENSMDLMNRLKKIFAEYLGEYDLKYRQVYIGLSKDGNTNNFLRFTPQREDLVVSFVMDRTEDIDNKLNESGLSQLAYDKQFGTYKIKIEKKDLSKNRDVLNFLVKTAYESNRRHQIVT